MFLVPLNWRRASAILQVRIPELLPEHCNGFTKQNLLDKLTVAQMSQEIRHACESPLLDTTHPPRSICHLHTLQCVSKHPFNIVSKIVSSLDPWFVFRMSRVQNQLADRQPWLCFSQFFSILPVELKHGAQSRDMALYFPINSYSFSNYPTLSHLNCWHCR
jgi:hypothetical protein